MSDGDKIRFAHTSGPQCSDIPIVEQKTVCGAQSDSLAAGSIWSFFHFCRDWVEGEQNGEQEACILHKDGSGLVILICGVSFPKAHQGHQ